MRASLSALMDVSGVLFLLRRQALGDFAGAGALQALLQGAVGINVFGADKTFVCVRDRVQSATAALDRLAHEDDPKRHAEHDEGEQSKGEDEGGHGWDSLTWLEVS